MDNMMLNRTLSEQHEPDVFDGDVHLVVADEERLEVLRPESWHAFITGTVDEFRVQCRHAVMLEPSAMRQYGKYLSDLL
jgi:thioesterase domain-containing protein